ncbi:MAG: UvrD-helicase domain-containing protein [Gemmataceae bacterium]
MINPARHAVIEASAGTGKTFTLVELAKLLIAEGRAQLDEILLVTYTEKATGELKSRLRQELETMLQKAPARLERIQAALDSFDQANIFTIHGFCQRILQEYAFENQQNLRPELVNDPELFEICLRDIQRTVWPTKFGELLPTVLEVSGFSDGKQGGASWERDVLQIAGLFRRQCGHQILPLPAADLGNRLKELEVELSERHAALRRLAEPLEPDNIEGHEWWTGYGKLTSPKSWLKSRREQVLLPVLRWLASPQSAQQPLTAFCRLLRESARQRSFPASGFLLLTDKLNPKDQPLLPKLCPNLQKVVKGLENLRTGFNWEEVRHGLAIETVHGLQSYSAHYKSERGLQSFEEMLTHVDAALDPAHNPRYKWLLGTLRKRYRYAIVDEFQDTDPIQWRIFQRLFVEGAGENRLFVVGDPKQAIFGFRGADVHTYLDAKARLQGQHQAQVFELKDNWRSEPRLIKALNQVFNQGDWFGQSLPFTPVDPAPQEMAPYYLESDHTGRSALNLIDLSASDKLTAARYRMGQFIAQEIKGRLLPRHGVSALQYRKNGATRSLNEGDICILVAKRSEAGPVVAELSALQIPYSFHKLAGLWQSDEAIHLQYLLRAIAQPGDSQAFAKGLLTRFFRIPAADLSQAEDSPGHHPARKLIEQWRRAADRRNWARLFQSLEEDTGLLFHDKENPDADRQRANLRHIVQFLQRAAYAQDLDLLGIMDLLAQKRRAASEEEADLQPVETEAPKVKIMTIHASKGLEFPIVFLAGGFTAGQTPGWATYSDSRFGHVVFDLAPDAVSTQRHKQEQNEEARRLFYVGLTRAMFKLYLPYLREGQKFRGQAGHVLDILSPALHKSKVAALGSPYAEIIDPSRQLQFTTVASPRAGCPAADVEPGPCSLAVKLPDRLFPRLDADLPRRRIEVNSFSSLHRQDRAAASEETVYAELMRRDDDDEPDILETADPLRGPVFGEMVHDILETADFENIGHAGAPEQLPIESQALIEQIRVRHWAKLPARITNDPALEEVCRQELARLVWHALHTPLADLGGPLWAIPKKDRLHEMEFYFPQQDQPVNAKIVREEFITGFMDLVVRKERRYFLVDWKTNYLPGGYSPDGARQSMIDSNYILQYRLYVQALHRWLKLRMGKAFDWTRNFGGVYYLYLRGLNGINEDNGVFFHRPTAEDMAGIQI